MPPPGSKAPRRRNLIVVRAGEDSMHPMWLSGKAARTFDLLVSYYGDQPERYREQCDFYHAMKGPRWPAHDAICRANQALLSQYDFICFACDDIAANQRVWNTLFKVCGRFGLDLAQPAVTGDVTHKIVSPVPGSILRFTNFVEIMCPVFSRRAFQRLHESFRESRSGWGLDLLWPKLLAGQDAKIAIVDAVRVAHTRPLRQGTLYPVLAKLGVDPLRECEALRARFGLGRPVMRELGRVVPGPAATDKATAPQIS